MAIEQYAYRELSMAFMRIFTTLSGKVFFNIHHANTDANV